MHGVRRRILMAVMLGGLVLASSLTAAENSWINGIDTGRSPRPLSLTAPQAWRQAADIAAHLSHAFVLVGDGESMQPLYPSGTILVLKPVPYPQLQRGQTVLYRDRENHLVAHVLVAKARDGWRISGLNNRIHDMEPVHAGNLVGVVVAAYTPVGEPSATSIAMR